MNVTAGRTGMNATPMKLTSRLWGLYCAVIPAAPFLPRAVRPPAVSGRVQARRAASPCSAFSSAFAPSFAVSPPRCAAWCGRNPGTRLQVPPRLLGHHALPFDAHDEHVILEAFPGQRVVEIEHERIF